MSLALAVLVFLAAATIDYAETRYVWAVNHGSGHAAGCWSVIMYAAGCLGFFAVIRVSAWLMVPEAIGFYCGTRLALAERLRLPRAVARYLHGSRSSD